jgi:hypothetical protein
MQHCPRQPIGRCQARQRNIPRNIPRMEKEPIETMNYIHKLQADNAELHDALADAVETVQWLKEHLHSSKFKDDNTIQVNDVLRWANNDSLHALQRLSEQNKREHKVNINKK